MNDGMNDLVLNFPKQIRSALAIADGFENTVSRDFDNVLICGLGGSGIGGTILTQLIVDQSAKPITVSKDYSIPTFVNSRTLVIACSYSGNTEETLEAVEKAIDSKAQIACITSGGKLLELAKSNAWNCIVIPSGYPPRAAFGFSFVQLLKLAECFGLANAKWKQELEKAVNIIQENQADIRTKASHLADSLSGKMPVIYSSNWLEGVGTRWRQQINENSKMLCWHHYYPEMNHNELVGWRTKDENLGVVLLKSNFDHSRVVKRMELSEKVFLENTPNVFTVQAIGDSKIEHALYLIHFGDWVSCYLADKKGADSTEVKVIDWLKGELSNF